MIIQPIKNILKYYIRNNRRNTVCRLAATIAEKYLHSFYNEDFYEFERNGECFVIDTFSLRTSWKPRVVWDVGANRGQWAREFHKRSPQTSIVSFEIIPALASELATVAMQEDWWRVEPIGLSNRESTVEVVWNRTDDKTSAISPILNSGIFEYAEIERILCPVTTLDAYWHKSGIAPDFLKIDAEGHDWAVLEGGNNLISGPAAPTLIQFEYGHTWTGAQRLLRPVQARLEELGYAVGRLYPNHVDFRPFRQGDEHFRMGNVIAVRDHDIHRALLGY